MNKTLIIILIVLALLGFYVMTTYNGLVSKHEQMNLKWNEVQNNYQRRLDLIPNLVRTVKGGAEYEQTTLTQVAEARAKMTGGEVTVNGANAQMDVQDKLAGTVNRLLAVVENYPELKGTTAFLDLQAQLEGTERRVKISRKDFNESVQVYNSSVRSFPTSFVAGMLGFQPKDGFRADAGAEQAVEIKF